MNNEEILTKKLAHVIWEAKENEISPRAILGSLEQIKSFVLTLINPIEIKDKEELNYEQS